ncbi:hypothetical protein E3P86_02687 [Wallemia ichthyophaga]|uniref:Uncharacterized protein n=1 Tax=Wallemia ichthyophaga TaxID=245174 RepID=A0A4T0J5X9_WALIC|nr:hypothetical protein E3P86_02687 [Wallemia ichthyophaga]
MSDEFLILDELLSYTRELNKQNKQSAQSTQITHNSQPAPSVAGKSKNPGPKGLYYTTLKGQPPWAYIRNRHGKNGTVDQTLAKRSHIDLQDKARIMSGKLWREGKDIPEWLIAAKPPKRILDKMRPTRGEWPKRQSDSANSSLSQQESSSHHASPQTSTPQSPAPPIAFTSDANVFSQASFTTDTFNH